MAIPFFDQILNAVGGAVGKAIGKVIDYIPSPEQSNRNKIEKLKKERDEILRNWDDSRKPRLDAVLAELRQREADLQNR